MSFAAEWLYEARRAWRVAPAGGGPRPPEEPAEPLEVRLKRAQAELLEEERALELANDPAERRRIEGSLHLKRLEVERLERGQQFLW